ncbi:MAG: hypothetical protein LBT50_02225 [Prevotellaceae bacterium]|jgi:hypothetical protein|nr:hypothetical protein [Prevotellaceae bacterium]
MRLEQYFKSCKWKQVRETMLGEYGVIDHPRFIGSFKKAFYAIQKEPVIPNDWTIIIYGEIPCEIEHSENPDLSEPPDDSWAYKSGMQVVVTSDFNLSPADIVANFLWTYESLIYEKYETYYRWKIDRINRFFRKIKSIPGNIRKMRRRYKYGYTQIDVWNIHTWFSTVAPKILSEYRKGLHGYPHEFSDKGGIEAWEAIIDRMIFCFTEMDEDTSSVQEEYKKEYWEDIYSGQIKYCSNEEVSEYREQMKNEGLELFRKYFWNLWD